VGRGTALSSRKGREPAHPVIVPASIITGVVRYLLRTRCAVATLMVAICASSPLLAQTVPASATDDAPSSAADIRQHGGKLVLVLPFENRSGQPNLSWIGDSFPWTLGQRMNSAGFLTIGRDDRQYAMDHLGLPEDFKPSRATAIRIAQQLDADYIIVGSYNIANPGTSAARIDVQAQVLEVNQLRMSQPITGSGELPKLFDVENALAWRLARRMAPHFAVAEQTFLAASGGVALSAFENYIRGISAPTAEERLKRLQDAAAAAPGYTPVLLALGKEQYARASTTRPRPRWRRCPRMTGSRSRPASTAVSRASTPQNMLRRKRHLHLLQRGSRCPRSSITKVWLPAGKARIPSHSSSR